MPQRYNKLYKLPYLSSLFLPIYCLFSFCLVFFISSAAAEELNLQEIIDEALKNSPEILAYKSRVDASKHRIPQAKSLPDPMFMFGYQNEGWKRYTFGEMPDAQWMFSASQMFPFPGKLSTKGEMALRESEGLSATYDSLRLKTIARVKELYYDLFLAHKNISLFSDRKQLLLRIEDAALSRYSTGIASQQEVLMAQIEKYMLMEREEMQRQKTQSLQAMLNSILGKDVNAPIGRPTAPPVNVSIPGINDLLTTAFANSPEIRSRERMVAAAEAKLKMAELEYYPDFTINASYFNRGGGEFLDMWSVTTTMNIPLFYKTKQKEAVNEAKATLAEARHELEAAKLMLSSNIREAYSMFKSAERLKELYKQGIIPKTYMDFESSLASYMTGRDATALTVLSKLKALLDYETLYWSQFADREKAAARLEFMAGILELGGK